MLIEIAFLLLLSIPTGIGALIWASNKWIKVNRVVLRIKHLPRAFEGYKIVLLSDLHDSSFGRGQERLLQAVARQRPDLIAFVGDLIEGERSNIEKALQFMADLNDIAPVYYVEGNHELSSNKSAFLFEGLKQRGISRLFNNWAVIALNNEQIIIAGVGDGWGRCRLDMALEGKTPGNQCILLAHNPSILAQAARHGVDLVLAGHHHGGQIRLPFLPALLAPSWEIFPRFDSGVYREGRCQMYLTRGLGHTGPINFRFFNRPEVALIVLGAEDAK